MQPIIGNESRVALTIDGQQAAAVRTDGTWHIEPAELAVSKANSWQHLRDLRSAVRAHNA